MTTSPHNVQFPHAISTFRMVEQMTTAGDKLCWRGLLCKKIWIPAREDHRWMFLSWSLGTTRQILCNPSHKRKEQTQYGMKLPTSRMHLKIRSMCYLPKVMLLVLCIAHSNASDERLVRLSQKEMLLISDQFCPRLPLVGIPEVAQLNQKWPRPSTKRLH